MANPLPYRWWRSPLVLREPEVYLLLLRIYFPILFPLTFLIVLAAKALDRAIGTPALLPPPLNYWLAAILFLIGAFLWAYTYDILIHGGKGSPSPSIARTTQLVTWGIYARCRNPSVLGKLVGVVSVGFLVDSLSFVALLVPLLLVGSMVEKVWRQEPVLIELFGDEYLEYRKRVPLFIPRIFVPKEELHGPFAPGLDQVAPPADGDGSAKAG